MSSYAPFGYDDKFGFPPPPAPGPFPAPPTTPQISTQPTTPRTPQDQQRAQQKPTPGLFQPGISAAQTAQAPTAPAASSRALQSFQEINSNIPLATWQQWDKFADPACPPQSPYRSQKILDGQKANTCEETPDNCPPGTQAFGKNECRRTGGGPGGGGPGGGGPGGGGGFPGGPGGDIFGLDQYIKNFLNQPSRYSPQVLALLEGQLRSGTEASVARGERGVRADAARRGLSRAGQTSANLAAVRRGAESAELGGRVAIQQDKIRADQEDKLASLDRAQKYLDSLRDHLYRTDLTALQRQQFQANLALAYANIQSQFDLLRAGAGYDALRGAN